MAMDFAMLLCHCMLVDQTKKIKLDLVGIGPEDVVRLEHHVSHHLQISNVVAAELVAMACAIVAILQVEFGELTGVSRFIMYGADRMVAPR